MQDRGEIQFDRRDDEHWVEGVMTVKCGSSPISAVWCVEEILNAYFAKDDFPIVKSVKFFFKPYGDDPLRQGVTITALFNY